SDVPSLRASVGCPRLPGLHRAVVTFVAVHISTALHLCMAGPATPNHRGILCAGTVPTALAHTWSAPWQTTGSADTCGSPLQSGYASGRARCMCIQQAGTAKVCA